MTVVEPTKKSNKWIWIGLGGTLLFCLCAVGVTIFLAARVGQKVQEGFKTDPESAAKAAHAITDYELPPGYQEQISMELFVYSMVLIDGDSAGSATSTGKPLIMLAQFQASATDQKQMEEQIRRSFEQQSGQSVSMKVVETKTMTIRGSETEVVISEGTDESGSAVRQLVTTFPGKNGTAMLIIIGEPENWDQEEIDTFIASIH